MPDSNKTILKRLPKGCIDLMFAGDLILARCPKPEYRGLFRRFETVFETFANMDKNDRLLRYRLLNALMLTSHAKKCKIPEEKRELFELKNNIFLSISTNPDLRRKVQYHHLVSKNFRVLKYCEKCTETNAKSSPEDQRSWKHCRSCTVDRNFYNIIAMNHQFPSGSACVFISYDQLKKIGPIKLKTKGKLGELKEEARLEHFHYNIRNLDAISLDSVKKMHEILMAR